ncbi:MAG: cobaltochelatase subunit CobN [Candidatus Wukongarchaeota archaeon]|nr:cobaltochelatase subunit CobN [Candidatus Wukongarchaeota archaeon]MDO8129591.1 cobaltochelatase subunit CobN [Candidatus Wukongarchaeota archaeon]
MTLAKIGFVSSTLDDNLIFNHILSSLKDKVSIEFKIINVVSTEAQIEEFFEFTKEASVVFTKLMGGKDACPFFDALASHLKNYNVPFIPLPTIGDSQPELDKVSTVPNEIRLEVIKYLALGGEKNYENLLLFLSNRFSDQSVPYEEPESMPWQGIYYKNKYFEKLEDYLLNNKNYSPSKITIGVLFYRTCWLSNNLDFIDHLIEKVEEADANVIPLFFASPNEFGSLGIEKSIKKYFYQENKPLVDIIINTTSFFFKMQFSSSLIEDKATFLEELNVPVLQGIITTGSIEEWRNSVQGLNPLDVIINAVMPEFDGLIIHFPLAGRPRELSRESLDLTNRLKLKPIEERMEKIVQMVIRYAVLKKKPDNDERVAIIFHNYPPRNDLIGSAFGLDAPQSVINILKAMKERGFTIEHIPENPEELINKITECATGDQRFITEKHLKQTIGRATRENYEKWFNLLSPKVSKELKMHWGEVPGEFFNYDGVLIFAGIANGNIFIGLQPPRGYGAAPSSVYHDPDLPPPYHYIAYYKWVKDVFKANVLVHVGKHGTLEWLPGKGFGLSCDCYPDICMELPNIYPYIINNPGEGTQAKRRSYATIVDHMIPPMTFSDLYENLSRLERSIEEYHEAKEVDEKRIPPLKKIIVEMVEELKLTDDLKAKNIAIVENENGADLSLFEDFLEKLHVYLYEIKEREINNGLHVLGQPLEGDKLVETVFTIMKTADGNVPSLREGVSECLGYDYKEILKIDNFNEKFGKMNAQLLDEVNNLSLSLLKEFYQHGFKKEETSNLKTLKITPKIQQILEHVVDIVLPKLELVTLEIENVLRGIEGQYIPAGPSGCPTRNTNVLPTGRNFYSCDPREIPTFAAYMAGKQMGDDLLKRVLEETGKYPESLGMVVWGTPIMRTKGEDIAEILYLLGLKPKYNEKDYVIGLEVIPLEELKRPRIDVTLRVSGFFRDAFPNLVDLLDEAIQLVATLDEPEELNFIKKHFIEEMAEKIEKGMTEKEAKETSLYRIFGEKPGSYGAGIAEVLEQKNWETLEDLAKVYVTWGSYVYGKNKHGLKSPEEFVKRLSKIEVTVKNEDSHEWDIFEADDWADYHGGMIAAVKVYSGKAPKSFKGDTTDLESIKTRSVKEEATIVFRTVVINPKWIEGMKKHGYTGAGTFSKYIDNIYFWEATSEIIENWMFDEIAETYVFDEEMREFFEEHNPYALMNIIEKLLEAIERGLWETDEKMKENLKRAYLQIEATIEEKL